MTILGKNALIHVPADAREAWRDLCERVFGLAPQATLANMDVYRFADGGSIGVVIREAPLSPEQQAIGTWIELEVEDMAGTMQLLAERGLTPLDHTERSHHYFRGPGGPIFRLGQRS